MMDEGLTQLTNMLALGDRIALKEFCDKTTVKEMRKKSGLVAECPKNENWFVTE